MLFAKWFLNIKERSKDSRESLHQHKKEKLKCLRE